MASSRGWLGSFLIVVCLALLLTPPPSPAAAADERPRRWFLEETNINPADAPTEFVVGVTPGYYESPRFDGTFDRYTVSAGSISHASASVDRGHEYWNVSSTVEFQGPPAFLNSGEEITLHASGSIGGSNPDNFNPFDQFEFRAEGISLKGETYMWIGVNPDFGPSSGALAPTFVVPEPWSDDAEIRIRAFYWNCAACLVEWVFRPEPAPEPTTTTTAAPTPTTTTTTSPPEPEQCFIRGVVTDGGTNPEGPTDPDGHALAGVRVALRFETLDEVLVAATDSDGRYEFTINKDNIPFSFDPTVAEFFVSLRLAEAAHDPARFEVSFNWARTELWSTPFVLDTDCSDGVIDVDFPLGAIPDDYLPIVPDAEYWDDLAEIYHRIHLATELADLLRQPLDYDGLVICAFCKNEKKLAAFWCGAVSNGANCATKPWIGFGTVASTLADLGWPDNREYHEFGHHFTADAFGNAIPKHSTTRNHAGYYVNPISTDAWTEGFAEFYSMMVTKYIEERPLPYLYRVAGTPRSLELDYRAWSNRGRYEELAVAGLLLDLEDGPDDYAKGRELPDLHVAWYDRYEDPALGTLIVGEAVNRTRTDYSEQTMVAAEFLWDGQVVTTAWAITSPWDIQPFGRGFFAVVAPTSTEWDEVRLAAFEGRPGRLGTDDDPVDLTLDEVWETVVSYLSVETESNGYLFDVADLHAAFKSSFGGMDADGDGMDDIDQVFVAHGLYADANGDRSFNGETPGRTDHPAIGTYVAMSPRRAVEPAAATLITIDTGGVDAAVVVQTWLPGSDENYSYVASPDIDGLFHVAVPPAGNDATVTLAVLADGYEPELLTTIEADAFWDNVLAGDDTPPSFTASLIPEGSGGGGRAIALAAVAAGVALLAAAVFWGRRRMGAPASEADDG